MVEEGVRKENYEIYSWGDWDWDLGEEGCIFLFFPLILLLFFFS